MSGINTNPITPTKLTLTMNEPDTAASGVLTSDNTQVTAGKKVTLGDIIYTFVASLTTDPDTIPYEVLIGADADGTLANLQKAINGTGTPGTEYSVGTEEHPDVSCGDVTAHAVTVTAKVAGLAGNSIAKAEDDAHLDWDGVGATLTGGDIGQVDSIPFGSSGFVKKLIVSAPNMPGSATYVLRILDKDGVVILESAALDENELSYIDIGFVLVADDVVQIDTDTDLTSEQDFIIIAR